MKKDEIVAYLEAYAASFDPPLREGVSVSGVRRVGAIFEISTSAGDCTADQVGGIHRRVSHSQDSPLCRANWAAYQANHLGRVPKRRDAPRG